MLPNEGHSRPCMTTNGICWPIKAQNFTTRLRRLNTSLDTSIRHLSPQRARTAGQGDEGILAPSERDSNRLGQRHQYAASPNEVVPLAAFARCMAWKCVSSKHADWCRPLERDKVYFAHEILESMETEVAPLVPVDDYTRAPPWNPVHRWWRSRRHQSPRSRGRFGMSCNRIP